VLRGLRPQLMHNRSFMTAAPFQSKMSRMGTWRPSVFPGTAEERDAFLRMDCTCRRGKDGHTVVCGTHALLLDERVVKHLIFYRRCHTLLWPGEARTS
jgi:hypothetical protein